MTSFSCCFKLQDVQEAHYTVEELEINRIKAVLALFLFIFVRHRKIYVQPVGGPTMRRKGAWDMDSEKLDTNVSLCQSSYSTEIMLATISFDRNT